MPTEYQCQDECDYIEELMNQPKIKLINKIIELEDSPNTVKEKTQ